MEYNVHLQLTVEAESNTAAIGGNFKMVKIRIV